MANTTAWTGGALNSFSTAYQAAFNAADLNGLANLSSVLASTGTVGTVLAFDNTVALDQFMDVSFVGAFAAAQTVASGAGIGLWLAILQKDAATYGGGRLTAGTQSPSFSPLLNPLGGIPIEPGTSITNISGSLLGVAIPPRKFALILQNQTGFQFASSGCSCSISTYRQNTNA